ncbi:TIGR03013 family XrtA/PEP-CTERM system glycosyltransferase [Nitrosomonas sp. Nm34]|uniref:TIGR03013 family XrtA/PEP-CTERM system glycosyltransferase n=1 Tax=Nitrosomonas sp. Nm34 TaxID=1881055 RepID=UPI0008DFCA89|nr:TIGR03013 family XrtA/PEP-CTERM system glycosyltransferase [Nitrosomonas sp. Nm34]SFI70349.1 sugar transferase, PEP-CTERM system associated/exopolysaccharide biosynthesis polyprenyl glycosylphosphotransferase [Nitrosomonas sp. Nm34]
MIRIYNHYISRFTILLISIEVCLLMTVFFLGSSIHFHYFKISFIDLLLSQLPGAIVFIFVMITCMAMMGMYQQASRLDIESTLLRLMPSLAMGFAIMALIFYLFPKLYLGRGLLTIVILLALLLILITRMIFFRWPNNLEVLRTRAIVLGTGSMAEELLSLTENSSTLRNLDIVGFIPLLGEDQHVPVSVVLPTHSSLPYLVNQYDANEIIIATQERRGRGFPIQELLECKMHGIKVTDIANLFERECGQIRMDSLYPSWLVFGGGFDQSFSRITIKRIFDLLASLLLLFVTLPVMLLTVIFILIEDGRPVFYRQERVGKGGRNFLIIKFRSMRHDAERSGQTQWTAIDHPHVTKIGQIIRRLRIDELPQIMNVLKGEMSLVGPRPESPYFVDMLIEKVPYYNVRHSIKPGITGWAQVHYPYAFSVEDAIEKLQYDLYYIKNQSLFLDLIILIETIGVVLLGKGNR